VGRPAGDHRDIGGGTGLGPVEVIVFAVPFVLPIAAAIYLGIRLRAHANTSPNPTSAPSMPPHGWR
jgi:hypothetical protein